MTVFITVDLMFEGKMFREKLHSSLLVVQSEVFNSPFEGKKLCGLCDFFASIASK
jgi:hypothetical protein